MKFISVFVTNKCNSKCRICNLSDKLIECARNGFKFKVAISVDGAEKKYHQIRGVDNYKNILETAKKLKELKISTWISYTVSPYNTEMDLVEVNRDFKGICPINIGFYNNVGLLNTNPEKKWTPHEIPNGNYAAPKVFYNLYRKHFIDWKNGKSKILGCRSIFLQCFVYNNGNVHLCQNHPSVGNIYKSNLEEIWKNAKPVRQQLYHCNNCFLICQRPIDLVFYYSNLFSPLHLIEELIIRKG